MTDQPHQPSDPLSLEDRVAVVTGAGAGLGRAEAVALARAGAHVVLNDLPGAADEAAEEIRQAGGEATLVAGDIGERSTADALLEASVDRLGRLDVVVNNAGMIRDRMLFNMSDDEWDQVIRVHLRSESDLYLTLTAQLTTLVPGSLVVEANRQTGVLYLHVLDVGIFGGIEKIRADTLGVEARVLRALASDEELSAAGLTRRRARHPEGGT